MTDPADIGKRVLEGLALGRRAAIRAARTKRITRLHRVAALIEAELRHGRRGLAARIARRLGVSLRSIQRDMSLLRGAAAAAEYTGMKHRPAICELPIFVYGRWVAEPGAVVILPAERTARPKPRSTSRPTRTKRPRRSR